MGSLGDDDAEMKPSIVSELSASIKFTNNLPDSFTLPSKFTIRSLLQLKLQSMRISGVLRENVDVFKCMFLKPLYLNKSCGRDGTFFMHSKFKNSFYGCAILITTQQDGYLYQINSNSPDLDASKCFLNVYPFTSGVVDVYFNDNVLHALCENGIESYTHRIGQKLLAHELSTIYNHVSSSISLVNLRPFMNVHFMIPGDKNLILLANDSSTPVESSEDAVNWTIYNLQYPSINTIVEDFKEFADKSLRKYPIAYLNLLEEIHIMIRTHMMLATLEPEENSEQGNEMRLVWDKCEGLLREASLALADFFIS